MSALGSALLAELSDADLDRLAELLAPRLGSQAPATEGSPWLGVDDAATYLGCPRSRIYALVSARRIPHCRDGSRLLFDRTELDAWVRAGGAKRP
jgi:excisionase family DNA binding protein